MDNEEGRRLVQRFKDIRGYLGLDEGYMLYCWAKEGPGEGVIVELGSFMGRSTCWLAEGSRVANRGKVFACDNFRGYSEEQNWDTLPQFRANIEQAGLSDWVDVRVGTSENIGRSWQQSQRIRLLFIDADHSYEASRLDFITWFPYVEPGGIVAFHDIGYLLGCSRFYNDLLRFNPEIEEVGSVGSLRLVRLPSSGAHVPSLESITEELDRYQQLLEGDVLDVGGLIQLGTFRFEQMQLEGAERCYRRAMALSPSEPIRNNLALILVKSGKVDEAVSCYDGHTDPRWVNFQQGQALDEYSQAHYDRAEFWYRRILDVTPNSVLACNNLAVALGKQGKIKEAAEYYGRAISLDPGTTSLQVSAEMCYRQLVEQVPSAETFNNLAMVLVNQDRFEEAIGYYTKAIGLDPQRLDYHFNLASAYHRRGDYGQAEVCYRRALTMVTNSPVVWCRLGFVVGLQGRIDEALECFQRAIVLQPAAAGPSSDEVVVYLSHLRSRLQGQMGRIDAMLSR
ncbi:MAG: tetratricopeptide repeat protein [Magnetococcales bacterium]|nr:tetratricopeptide repeat protein [Magnetococcales bacterium]